jgi:hypothetical protein
MPSPNTSKTRTDSFEDYKLTDKQEDTIRQYDAAVRLLHQAGFNAKFHKYWVSSTLDNLGYISLEDSLELFPDGDPGKVTE